MPARVPLTNPVRAAVKLRRGEGGESEPGGQLIQPSNNGSAYIAKKTAQTTAALDPRLPFMPVRPPQSIGISKAFVNTLKRDYAHLAIPPHTETTMRLLSGSFEDYNAVHPHYDQRMLSPRISSARCLNPSRRLSNQTK